MTTGWYRRGFRPEDSPTLGSPKPGDPGRTAQLLMCPREGCDANWIGYLPPADYQAEVDEIMFRHACTPSGVKA